MEKLPLVDRISLALGRALSLLFLVAVLLTVALAADHLSSQNGLSLPPP